MNKKLDVKSKFLQTTDELVVNDEQVKEIAGTPSDEHIEVIAERVIESAPEGTVDTVLGLDENGDLVQGAVSGGTNLYLHKLVISLTSGAGQTLSNKEIYIVSTKSTGFVKEDFDMNNYKSTLGKIISIEATNGFSYLRYNPGSGLDIMISVVDYGMNSFIIYGTSLYDKPSINDTVTLL